MHNTQTPDTALGGVEERVGAPELPSPPVTVVPKYQRTGAGPNAPDVTRPADEADKILTARERVFIEWYTSSRNLMQAYRQAYECASNASNGKIYSEAHDVARRPHVAKAIRDAQEYAASQTIIRAAEILQDLADIATADPNDLIKGERYNCRHCNGVNFAYQWRDAAEFALAMDKHLKSLKTKKKLPLPTTDGGFGFHPRHTPHAGCPECYGDGHFHLMIPDTTKLSPKSRKLYKGVKQTATGIEVLMHDQMQARDMALKMLGAYKTDGKPLVPTGAAAEPTISESASAEDAQRAYLRLVRP